MTTRLEMAAQVVTPLETDLEKGNRNVSLLQSVNGMVIS
jgi:hypothetical protein